MPVAPSCPFGVILASWIFVLVLVTGGLGVWATARVIKMLGQHGAKGAHMAESLSHLIMTGGDLEAREREAEAKRFLNEREYESLADPELTRYANAARRWFKATLALGVALLVATVLFQSMGSMRCLVPG